MNIPDMTPAQANWNRRLAELKAYGAKFGHRNVTPKTPGFESLGSWASSQRVRRKKGLLNESQVADLDALGFVWDLQGLRKSATFDGWAEQLARFLKKFGHANVTPNSEGYEALGSWAIMQRTLRKKGLLDDNQIRTLDGLNFVWELQSAKAQQTWIKKYHELEAYYLEHGHSDMPRTHENKTLANWVWIQRLRRKGPYLKSEQLTPAEIALLDKLAFKWDPHEDNWAESYQELKAYGAQHAGRFDPIEDETLSRWASSQRRAYHQGELAQERIDQLNAIAFTWESAATENQWQAQYAELKAYHQAYGDANPSRLRIPQLGGWCGHQRLARKAGKLAEHHIRQLDELGFVWSHHEKTPWEVHFVALEDYIKVQGDSYVPQRYDANPKLGFFTRNLRVQYEAGKLSPEQIAKLEAIGFQWTGSGRRGRRRRG